MNGDPKLGKAARDLLARGGTQGGFIVPAISVWEVAMLEAKGRISFELSIQRWVGDALAAPQYHLAELTPSIAIRSARLPGDFISDPSDRMIVATAVELGAPLATRDAKIQAYAAAGSYEVMPI